MLPSTAALGMHGVGMAIVSMRTMRATADEAVELGLEAGCEYLAISVADAGAGMDETVRSRIFEPFLTTKPRAQGAALGLSVARRHSAQLAWVKCIVAIVF